MRRLNEFADKYRDDYLQFLGSNFKGSSKFLIKYSKTTTKLDPLDGYAAYLHGILLVIIPNKELPLYKKKFYTCKQKKEKTLEEALDSTWGTTSNPQSGISPNRVRN